MPTLHIIQGFIGSGKTTFATNLAQKTGIVRLNADEWCNAHFLPTELEKDWDACFAQSVETTWENASDLLKSNQDVILDIGFWSKASRDYARAKAEEFGADFKHYYIFASDDILIERITQRSGLIAEKNLKNFYMLKECFEEPMADENHIRISTLSPAGDFA